MFDRVAVINLDKRLDRLGAFKAKVAPYPSLRNFVRYRAIHGDTVSVPKAFISGGGAWGCRQSHLRVLEDAMQDGVEVLLVLEDDCRFVPNFEQKLNAFMKVVPDDWEGLMLGGQDHGPSPASIGIEGVVRSTNTQRTHAYVVRGREPMRDLYRLWAWCDRHIDHWFGQWQQRHQVYQPVPFLCGQDETASDISGRVDTVRYWDNSAPVAKDYPIIVLVAERAVAEAVRNYGFHFGYDRDQISGRDNGLNNLESMGWPADRVSKWGDLIVNEALERGDVPGIWHVPTPNAAFLESRFGRPVKFVEARNVEEAVKGIPQLLTAWKASKIVWCWRGEGAEILEGLAFHGWHRGHWKDAITGLDQGIRQVVEGDKYTSIKNLVRQLFREVETIRYGKMLLAHPRLDVDKVRGELGSGFEMYEIKGDDVFAVMNDAKRIVDESLEMYKDVVAK